MNNVLGQCTSPRSPELKQNFFMLERLDSLPRAYVKCYVLILYLNTISENDLFKISFMIINFQI